MYVQVQASVQQAVEVDVTLC